MFSYSSNPIDKSSNIETTIDFISLIKKIKNPPKENVFPEIYRLRKEGKESECKLLKSSKLPWITPNCVVRKRSLKKEGMFNENYICSSGYIYFDVDTLFDNLSADELKEYMIQKYGNIVALISKSSSCRGISILVRINSYINNEDDFYLVYDYISSTYFSGITFDDNVRTLGASWYVPWDEFVFVNYENEIDVSSVLNYTKVSSDVLLLPPPHHIHRVTPKRKSKSKQMDVDYVEINISDVFDQCILETQVDILDSILIEPIPILCIRFPRIIKDTQKRKVFRKVIHDFMELNPNISYSHILKFIIHINEKFASPQMEREFLKKVVKSQFDFIRNQVEYKNNSKKSLRVIHYGKNTILKSSIKKRYSNKIRGVLDGYITHKKIINAINYLSDEHGEYVYQDISNLLEISLSTVKRHIRKKKVEYEVEFNSIVDEIKNHINDSNN